MDVIWRQPAWVANSLVAKYRMDAFNAVIIAAIPGLADRYFPSSGRVVLILKRSFEEDSALIDEATSWTRSAKCAGRSRRALASRLEAIFEFEDEKDAAKFKLLFG